MNTSVHCLTMLIAAWGLCVSPAGAQDEIAIADPPLAIGVNEIRLEGKITALDVGQKTITLEATSFTLPSGKTSRIAQPKPKPIQLNDKVLLYARGTPEMRLEIAKLQVGLFAVAVGRDTGTGQPLAARTMAVWKSERDGKFTLENAPAKSEPSRDDKPPAAKPVAPALLNANAPAALELKLPTTKNEIPNGDFEAIGDNLKPEAWEFVSKRTSQIVEEDNGNHYVLLKPVGGAEERKIKLKVLLMPTWKTLKMTARVRAKDLKNGTKDWDTAHLGLTYYDRNDKQVSYPSMPIKLYADTNWTVRSGISNIPEGAHYAILDATHQGVAGEFAIDDIHIEPDGKVDAPDLIDGFPEGDFEKKDENGNPIGWSIVGVPNFSVEEEDDNTFLRLVNNDPKYITAFDIYRRLKPGTRQLRIRVKLRGVGIKPGDQPWKTARLGWLFTDDKGNQVGGYPQTADLLQDTDWAQVEVKTEVPEGATLIKITPILLYATGTFDVDDLKIEAVK